MKKYASIVVLTIIIIIILIPARNLETNYFIVVCIASLTVLLLYIGARRRALEIINMEIEREREKLRLAEIEIIENERLAKLDAERKKQLEQYIARERRADDRRKAIAAQKIENLDRKIASITDEHM